MNPNNHQQPASPPVNAKESLKGIFSTIALLVGGFFIAVFLVTFVFQSYQVDGPSMETSLQNNDRLIVLKLPRTLARITRQAYIPNRGDVIVFNHPEGIDGQDVSRQLIKRVVALPGERVVVKDGSLTVYNKANPQGFSPDKTLPYGSVITETNGEVDLTVPANEVFVAGDNRGNSLDSRYFGPVAASDIVGKLELRLYPFTKAKLF